MCFVANRLYSSPNQLIDLMQEEKTHPVKTYSTKALASLYGVTVSTFMKEVACLKLPELPPKKLKGKKIFYPSQVRKIFDENKGLGKPDKE